MSFSSKVKNELCRMEIYDDCCLFSELAAVVRISGTIKIASNSDINIKIVTENAAFARRIFSIIKKLYNIQAEVVIRKSRKFKKHISYSLIITSSMGSKKLLDSINISTVNCGEREEIEYLPFSEKILKSTCCKKAFLRGAFLAGGSVSDPEKTYHLEIYSHNDILAHEISRIINKFKLHAKVAKRKGNYIIYLKEGENIVDFLNIMGAHLALMDLENIRILKEMRNNVNRIVNCETANLEKTVSASLRQVEDIKFIRDNIGFGNLPRNLREIAEVRLQYPDASLKELGEMLSPQLGKSGVNHRLHKLGRIAEEGKVFE